MKGRTLALASALAALCMGVLMLPGCGETASARSELDQMWENGGCYGLWVGNVEVIPSRPAELPPVFFEEMPPTAAVPVDGQGRPLAMDPAKINKPLWVFANQIDIQNLSDKVHDAQTAGRPIVIFGAETNSIEQLFGQTSAWNSLAPTETAWSWLPWMARPLTVGGMAIAPGEHLSSRDRQMRYYLFMVESTLRLEPPDMSGGQ